MEHVRCVLIANTRSVAGRHNVNNNRVRYADILDVMFTAVSWSSSCYIVKELPFHFENDSEDRNNFHKEFNNRYHL